MLVLTRRVEEGIMIGDTVLIKVLEIKGHQVKIGIEAPRTTGVYRDEIYQRIQEEKRGAPTAPEQSTTPSPQPPPSHGILDAITQGWKRWFKKGKNNADNKQRTATQPK